MKNNILHILVAALVIVGGCGLVFGACTSRERMLDAAIEAINKQYPMQIADGAVLEGFFVENGNIDIAVSQQESFVTQTITDERMEEMREGFKFYFAMAVREDNNLRDLFQLIADNGMTMSVSITLQPSKQKFSTRLSQDDIQQIVSVNKQIKK